jgi:hypothetical protein
MVRLSDSETDPKDVTPMAVDDEVRETGGTPPAEEPPEKRDSLLQFPSEGTTDEEIDVPVPERTDSGSRTRFSQSSRPSTQVPVAIIDDRASREAIRKLGEYSDTLAKLQEVCASIEARLGGAEESVLALRADRTLHELSARIETRLTEAEQAVQGIERVVANESVARQAASRSEGLITDRAVREVSARIETRLTEVEQAVQRVERAAASESVARQTSIEALLRQISKRLEQAEEFVRHSEGLITDRAVREVSARIETRLTEVEQAVQRVERAAASESVARQTSIEALLRQISKRLEQAEEFVRHSEGLITDRAVREVSARIETRLTEVERAVQRVERAAASESVARQTSIEALLRQISKRLEQAEEFVRHSEGLIVERVVREVSACIDARATGADEVVRRIEQVVADTRVSEPSPWLVPLVPPVSQRVTKRLAAAGALVAVAIFVLVTRVPIAGQPEPVSRAVDREVLLRDALVEAPAPLAVVLRPMSMPTVALTPAPARLPARSTPPAAPRPQTSTRRATVPAEADDVAPRSFVGDLTITSTPVGATVSINGRAAGVTPLVLRERPAGSVAVQINNDGFERWSASVQVRAGEMTNVSATLRRAQ